MTVKEFLDAAAKRLTQAEVDNPALSARLLLARVLGIKPTLLPAHRDQELSPDQVERAQALVERRSRGCPVAYLLEKKEFYGRDFRVDQAVLIPRPETEHLVEAVLERFQRHEPLVFADLGTGSGALAVTLALEFPNSRGLALDLSSRALHVARENARLHGVSERLEFVCADFTKPYAAPESLDLVVANPPYVSEAEFAAISREVSEFEPTSALVSPEDGLSHLRRLAPVAHAALRPKGWLVVELGCTQGPVVLDILASAFEGSQPRILPDLARLDRVGVVRRSGSSARG